MPLFNEEMIINSLEQFVEKTKKKYHVNGDTKEIAQMILDELETQARKTGKTAVGIGMSDEELEHAIIKSPAELPKWKKKKAEKKNNDSLSKTVKPVAEPKTKATKSKPSPTKTTQKTAKNKPIKELPKQNNDGEIEFSLFDF
jgi:hypothetical protein